MQIYYDETGKKATTLHFSGPYYELDEETGLPKVHREGDYYRVSRADGVREWFSLEYMRPSGKWWLPDSCLDSYIIGLDLGEELSAEKVLETALWQRINYLDTILPNLDEQSKKPSKPRKPKKVRPTPEERREKREKARELRRKIKERKAVAKEVTRKNRQKFEGSYPPKSINN